MACEDCKKQGQLKFNLMFFIGIELLGTAIYGHIVLISNVIDWLSQTF